MLGKNRDVRLGLDQLRSRSTWFSSVPRPLCGHESIRPPEPASWSTLGGWPGGRRELEEGAGVCKAGMAREEGGTGLEAFGLHNESVMLSQQLVF